MLTPGSSDTDAYLSGGRGDRTQRHPQHNQQSSAFSVLQLRFEVTFSSNRRDPNARFTSDPLPHFRQSTKYLPARLPVGSTALFRGVPMVTANPCERLSQVRIETHGISKRRIENRLHLASHNPVFTWRICLRAQRPLRGRIRTTPHAGTALALLHAHVVLDRLHAADGAGDRNRGVFGSRRVTKPLS